MKKIIRKIFAKEVFMRIVLPIILVIVLVVIGFFSFRQPGTKNLKPEEIQAKAETFVNTYLMQSGSKATIKEVTTEYGLYKLKIDIVSDVVESYITKDGKLFFPQALNIEETAQQAAAAATGNNTAANSAPAATVSVKSDKPTVELFVMSYCPYGTQIEKGILPVLAALGNKIDFTLDFCSYAMHGQKELNENLTQYCIQKEQTSKLNSYLACFLESSSSDACLTSAKVDKTKLAACVSKTDQSFKVTSNFTNNIGYQGSYPGFDVDKAANDKYNVGGSPTLIINGQEISSARDSASLLKTICSAFNNQPKECQTALSSTSPAAGFGSGTAAAGSTTAGCE
ncbi:MAG: hypothetical protein WC719_04575 [Patescibacteria group bacterium]|jgi:hypothetical protein